MSTFTIKELQSLRAPFPLEAHTIREGFKDKSGGKIRWFVYIERQAVQDRLDEVFPGEWETTEPKLYFSQTQYTRQDGTIEIVPFVSAVVGITIRGITRWDGGDSEGDESTKGALTNGFRRAAAYGWGIARYLYDMGEPIKTSSYTRGNWTEYDNVRDAAWKQFTTWYNRQFSGMPQNDTPQAQKQAQSAKQVPTTATPPKSAKKPIPDGWTPLRNALLTELSKVASTINYKERANTVDKMYSEDVFQLDDTLDDMVTRVLIRLSLHKQAKS
jgi:hypothetical protein